jgi:hypothetical protein
MIASTQPRYRGTTALSGEVAMEAKLIAFGEIEIDGERYDHDVVIEAGKVSKRAKKASKSFRSEYGHTPLSVEEEIP